MSSVNKRWYVRENDIVGGWTVTAEDRPVSELDASDWIADFIDEASARYVATLHNADLDGHIEWKR